MARIGKKAFVNSEKIYSYRKGLLKERHLSFSIFYYFIAWCAAKSLIF